jgi:hypothetical protein
MMAKNTESRPKLYFLLVARGLLVGLFFGVTARLWMRWISTDPEFTWNGTLGIVIGFGIFGAVQAFVGHFMRGGHRKWSTNLVRSLGVLFSLQLFFAAGASMFPAVLAGVLSLWRDKWTFWLRFIFGLIGIGWSLFIIQTAIVHEFGINVVTFAKVILMMAIYSWIIASLKSTVRGFQ